MLKDLGWNWKLWVVVFFLGFFSLTWVHAQTPAPFPCIPTGSGTCSGTGTFNCTQTGVFTCTKLSTGKYECKGIFDCPIDCAAQAASFAPVVRDAKIKACEKFSLRSDSPAIGAGDSENCPKTNFMGVAREPGKCNIGAF